MSDEQVDMRRVSVSPIWSRLIFGNAQSSKDSNGSEKEESEIAIERQTEKRWIRALPTIVEGTTAEIVDLIEGMCCFYYC